MDAKIGILAAHPVRLEKGFQDEMPCKWDEKGEPLNVTIILVA
jgi:hypothetical protein